MTSGELLLEYERARRQFTDQVSECAKVVLVGAVDRFVKHRCALLQEAASHAIACAPGGTARSMFSAPYFAFAADFEFQRLFSREVGVVSGDSTSFPLITYCNFLQRACNRRAAVQDGMSGFPSMPLSIEPPNVMFADLACMLLADHRNVVAECVFAQCATNEALRGSRVTTHSRRPDVGSAAPVLDVDSVPAAILSLGAPTSVMCLSSFLSASGASVFGAAAPFLPELLVSATKDALHAVVQSQIGVGGSEGSLFATLRDCIPLSLSVGKHGLREYFLGAWLSLFRIPLRPRFWEVLVFVVVVLLVDCRASSPQVFLAVHGWSALYPWHHVTALPIL